MPLPVKKATPSFEAAPMLMALIPALGLLIYAGWGAAPAPPKPKVAAALTGSQYEAIVAELAGKAHEAEKLYAEGKAAEAGALVQDGEKLATKVMSVPRPTLAATEAASDIDHLYGRMLAARHEYGWARLQFQKNLARWKYWKPPTEESARRIQQARDAIADCDKHIK